MFFALLFSLILICCISSLCSLSLKVSMPPPMARSERVASNWSQPRRTAALSKVRTYTHTYKKNKKLLCSFKIFIAVIIIIFGHYFHVPAITITRYCTCYKIIRFESLLSLIVFFVLCLLVVSMIFLKLLLLGTFSFPPQLSIFCLRRWFVKNDSWLEKGNFFSEQFPAKNVCA